MRMVRPSAIPVPEASNEERLRSVFDAAAPPTVGLEEELMLLDPRRSTSCRARRRCSTALGADPRFALELPASQLEIVVGPAATVAEAVAALAARSRRPGGLHRRRDPPGGRRSCIPSPRSRASSTAARATTSPWPSTARSRRRQLVLALQVHVAIRGGDRALAVHNALRSFLPELAALAANAPFHGGRDTGLASVQAAGLRAPPAPGHPAGAARPGAPTRRRWGSSATRAGGGGSCARTRCTGRSRCASPDAQSTVADAAAVAAVAHALTVWLAERHDAGEALPVDETWRIEENRWRACRHGVEGDLLDLRTGERRPARARLHALLDELEPRRRAPRLRRGAVRAPATWCSPTAR